MRYWWVNQNQTYKNEIPGGFMWSPKTRSDGGRNQFYENMHEVEPGDVVFSFCGALIKAVGVAKGRAETAPKPDFGTAGANWSREGWLVPVEFRELRSPIRPKDHIGVLRPHLPSKYSPLQQSGDGLQSVYLAEVPAPMATVLIELIGRDYRSVTEELWGEVDSPDIEANRQEEAIKGRTDIGETTKDQLVKARRGQGVFRANVRLNEHACRVTGVSELRHLRASHIKPWKDSSDEEKLNGCNGLLLAPHVDHLFDKGFITFLGNGELIVSPALDRKVLAVWGLQGITNVAPFNMEQSVFLEYHRNTVYKKA